MDDIIDWSEYWYTVYLILVGYEEHQQTYKHTVLRAE